MQPLTEIPPDAEAKLHDLPLPGQLGWPENLDEGGLAYTTCVYFVQDEEDGPIKIGVSTVRAFQERLHALQIGNPRRLHVRRLVLGSHGLERLLHKRYAEHKIHGEWFEPHPEVLAAASPEAVDVRSEVERLREARRRHKERWGK